MNSPYNGPENKKQKGSSRNPYKELGAYMTLGIQLAAAVVVFFLIGHWIDNRFEIAPIGKLIGILIGSIGGFVKFFKSVSSLTADEEQNRIDDKNED
jgi:F0F1-type ATP synthase assembly protein I